MTDKIKLKRLGDVCTFVRGPFGGSLKKDSFVLDGVAVYEQQHAIYNQFDRIRYFISEDKFEEMKRFKLNPGDLIMSCSGTMGKVAIVPQGIKKGIINQALLKLSPKSDLNIQYLKYWMESEGFKTSISNHSKGAAIKNVASVAVLKNIEIPLMDKDTQKQLVTILDDAFNAIDQAKANLERNVQNAKELFQSELNAVFSQTGEGWEKQRFDEVCVLQRGFDLPTHSRKSGDYPLVSANGITDSVDEWKVMAPGVVTGRSGTIGKVHYIDNNFWPLNTALYIKNFHGNYEKCVFYFLQYFGLEKYSLGAGVPTLNRNHVHKAEVYFPKSFEEQKAIAYQLDNLLEHTKQVESLYKRKLEYLEVLKKSILQKAFTGKLKYNEELAL